MSMFQTILSCALLCALMTSAASAEDQQLWSIYLEGAKATIRATPETKTKYIKSTFEALRSEKVETFALKTFSKKDLSNFDDADVVIAIHDQDAELTLTPDLEHRFTISLIKHLNEVGIHEVKLTLREDKQIAE